MLLARKGHRVLLVDRASFPSDIMSTHLVHPPAVALLKAWGLLDRLITTGCPPIHTYAFDFGQFTLSGNPGDASARVAYCPRRTVLDKLLVDGAVEAGAELREDFIVDELLTDGPRVTGIKGHTKQGEVIQERAEVVIGADGRNSLVADAVHAEKYNERAPLMAPYYSYWSGLPMDGQFVTWIRPLCGFALAQTHDDLTMIVVGWQYKDFQKNKHDIEGNYLATLGLVPEVMERLRTAKRETRLIGAPTPNFFRKPFGPGWALVGDAGYLKDPVTAQGIRDAFRDADSLAFALDQALSGKRSFDQAMKAYQRARDDSVLSMYDFTCQIASLEPPPPEMQQIFAACAGNQRAMDGFVRVNAGALSPAEFFSPENVSEIMAGR
jgi:2-polyprenyl-6-methoxyphenol hydroxylase-like FAD-dependent oxidoreductase